MPRRRKLPGCLVLRDEIGHGMTQAQIARKYNVARSTVKEALYKCRIHYENRKTKGKA